MKVLGPNDKTISGLGAASALNGADLVPVIQSGVTKKATMSQVGIFGGRSLHNASVSTPGAGFASDTYLAGSSITIPAGALQAKSMYRCLISVAKTNAGTAAPVLMIRYGTTGTIASDTSRCTFTFPAQTAVVDEGVFEVDAIFRSVGSGTSCVLAGVARLTHELGFGSTASTGLSVQSSPTVIVVGGGFDSTPANSIVGMSINGGTSAVWTIAVVQASLYNLA